MLEARQMLAAQVVCVPWQFDLPHEAISGSAAILKATIPSGTLPINYTWNFNDGSPVATGTINSDAERYAVEVSHTYTGTDGTPYTATLQVTDHDGNTAQDTYKLVIRDTSLGVQTNIAIDTGLWWWHKTITRTSEVVGGVTVPEGHWDESGYSQTLTGLATLAFENQAHLASGNPAEDPYVDDVQRGLNWMFRNMNVQSISEGPQCPYGNPDTNGNGIGINVAGDRYTYEIGPEMMAISASGTPDALAPCGPANVYNRSYRDIVEDMVEMCAWGQNESGVGRGGWRYAWNYGTSDNSIAQWPLLGMQAAQEHWGITPPSFVLHEAELWLNHSQYANGGWMYMDDYANSDDHAHAGAGIFALTYMGKPASDTRIVNALSWLDTYWNASVWTSQPAKTIWQNKYGMYAVMKGLRAAGISTVGTEHDWYSEFCSSLLSSNYHAEGYWNQTSTWTSGYKLDSIFSLLTLEPTISSPPPVAVLKVTPLQAQPGQVFTFDGSSSYHLDPTKSLVKFDFDFGDGTTYSETAANAPDGLFDGKTTHVYPDTVGSIQSEPGQQKTYMARLTITDNGLQPLTATATQSALLISLQNHPPVANAGGPYTAFVGIPLTLSGIGSYDPDGNAPLYNHIAGYAWELAGGAPYDFAEGNTVAVTHTWDTVGTYDVALQVTDTFGATTTQWTTVNVLLGIPTITFVRADQDAVYGHPGALEGRLTDSNGTPLAGMTLHFYFDKNQDNSFDPVTEGMGTGITNALGDATVPYPATDLPNFYKLQAVFEGSGLYLPSSDINFFQVKAPPLANVLNLVVNNGAVQRSVVNQMVLTFDQMINPSTLLNGGLKLMRRSGGSTFVSTSTDVTSQMVISNPLADGKTFLIKFSGRGTDPGGSLADGVYDLAVDATLVQDALGRPIVASKSFVFHRLFGDANGDKKVDWYDLSPFSTTYMKASTSKTYLWYFDFEQNGSVLGTDYTELLKRVNKKLVY